MRRMFDACHIMKAYSQYLSRLYSRGNQSGSSGVEMYEDAARNVRIRLPNGYHIGT